MSAASSNSAETAAASPFFSASRWAAGGGPRRGLDPDDSRGWLATQIGASVPVREAAGEPQPEPAGKVGGDRRQDRGP